MNSPPVFRMPSFRPRIRVRGRLRMRGRLRIRTSSRMPRGSSRYRGTKVDRGPWDQTCARWISTASEVQMRQISTLRGILNLGGHNMFRSAASGSAKSWPGRKSLTRLEKGVVRINWPITRTLIMDIYLITTHTQKNLQVRSATE